MQRLKDENHALKQALAERPPQVGVASSVPAMGADSSTDASSAADAIALREEAKKLRAKVEALQNVSQEKDGEIASLSARLKELSAKDSKNTQLAHDKLQVGQYHQKFYACIQLYLLRHTYIFGPTKYSRSRARTVVCGKLFKACMTNTTSSFWPTNRCAVFSCSGKRSSIARSPSCTHRCRHCYPTRRRRSALAERSASRRQRRCRPRFPPHRRCSRRARPSRLYRHRRLHCQ